MIEIWKDVHSYQESYEVSSFGNVRSKDRVVKSCHNSTRFAKGRPLKPFLSQGGYKIVSLLKDGKASTVAIHRLVAIAFIENKENKTTVNHIDGDKTNNNLNNLEWCTQSENIIHAYKKGLIQKKDYFGEKHPRTKFVNSDIFNIRARHANGESIASIARLYAVSESAIRHIIKGRCWAHI